MLGGMSLVLQIKAIEQTNCRQTARRAAQRTWFGFASFTGPQHAQQQQQAGGRRCMLHDRRKSAACSRGLEQALRQPRRSGLSHLQLPGERRHIGSKRPDVPEACTPVTAMTR
jgi:hypothetical protein